MKKFIEWLANSKQGLFYTPEKPAYIFDWIERHTQAEKVHLYTLYGMTVNFFAAQAQKTLDEERQPCKKS